MIHLFTIDLDESRVLIYAPLKKTAFIGNRSLAALVSGIASDPGNARVEDSPEDSGFLRFLHERGFFEPEEPPADEYRSTGILYDTVILFLTNQCNLRCGYCYAHSGEYPAKTMPWETAKAAIDYAWGAAAARGLKEFTLGFHGGGEPTLNREVLMRSVEYTEARATRDGVKLNLSGAFNGCWSGPMRDFIAGHFTEISISIDGLPEVQNAQRPKHGGAGSFGEIDKTLRALEAAGVKYGIRMTVTDDSVHRLSESVEFLCRNYKPLKIQAEPVFPQGRAVANDCAVKDLSHFVRGFVRGHACAKKNSIELFYSGARPDLITTRFCLAACRAFVVTADGDVTTCFESYGKEHPLSGHFIVGSLDGRGSFTVDAKKLEAYFRHTVDDNPHCAGCFCKWHCAGDCAIKTMRQDGGAGYSTTERCEVNREITLYLLLEKIRDCGGIVWLGDESPEAVRRMFDDGKDGQ